MTRKERYEAVIGWFEEHMPVAETELHYTTPFELLVAVILSAQCTDKRVNMITPRLFRQYPTAEIMARAEVDDIFELVRSVSYPRAKAGYLVAMAQRLVADHQGEVPEEREELMKLPGVGRKTANVVQAVAFHKAALAVDTHVFRVSHRLGLVPKTANTPYKVEMALKKYIPEEKVAPSHFWLLLHGRYVCTALRPKCDKCDLRGLCKGPLQIKKR